ncbi:MAG TPA: hypothetical protein VF339_20225 [Gammaproteobacteria bacterium]
MIVWHVAVHVLAVVSISLSGLVWPVKLAAGGALVAHAALRRPAAPMPIRRDADGTWSLPALGLDGLALRPGTAAGPFWVRLALGRAGVRTVTVVLVADQVDREAWRRLQAELRRGAARGTL